MQITTIMIVSENRHRKLEEISPCVDIQVANALNFKIALQDSHSILSTPTFTQPLLAQASELAAYITIIPQFTTNYRIYKYDKMKGHILHQVPIPFRVGVREICKYL